MRLERLCQQAFEEDKLLTAESAVPMLEAARTVGRGGGEEAGGSRLLDTCRRFNRDHGKEVKGAGGLEQLQELPVAVGLLGDSIDEVDRLRRMYEPDAGADGACIGSRKRRQPGVIASICL